VAKRASREPRKISFRHEFQERAEKVALVALGRLHFLSVRFGFMVGTPHILAHPTTIARVFLDRRVI